MIDRPSIMMTLPFDTFLDNFLLVIQGALVGAGVAAIAIAPVMFLTQIYISQNRLQFPAKPIFLDHCTQIYNVSQEFIDSIEIPEEAFWPRGPTR